MANCFMLCGVLLVHKAVPLDLLPISPALRRVSPVNQVPQWQWWTLLGPSVSRVHAACLLYLRARSRLLYASKIVRYVRFLFSMYPDIGGCVLKSNPYLKWLTQCDNCAANTYAPSTHSSTCFACPSFSTAPLTSTECACVPGMI